jgi:hypothetical protein
MRIYRPPLFNKEGASSVLIILIMVVLVVFGLAALTTSLAAVRLTDKSNEWSGEYYSLEGKAGNLLFEVDSILLKAENSAIDYIKNKEYLGNVPSLFSEPIQEMVYKACNFTLPESAKEEYLSRVMEAAFYKSAIDMLIEKYPRAEYIYNSGIIRQILEDEGAVNVFFSTTITENDGEFAKNLDVKLKLTAPEYYIKISGGDVSGNRASTPMARYKIVSWKEWQDYFDYSEKIEFDDAFE